MSCFPCFSSEKSDSIKINELPVIQAAAKPALPSSSPAGNGNWGSQEIDVGNIAAKTFTFRELASATKNFRQECLLGDGVFGKVYKGTLQSSGQAVAVKRLDRNGMQGSKEFLVEVLMLSLLKHENLLDLVGYCADGDQRLLVYNYMPLGSLDTHLFDVSQDKEPLDWTTRIKIAAGAAQGLEYLHDKANPPIVYRDMRASNILLEDDYKPRLCDIGLAKFAQSGNPSCTPPRVMNTYGYCAPEYTRTGQLTLKSDVYSFGVVLLELITGRRAMDPTRPVDEQNLVSWAQPIFKNPQRFPEMADPLLKGKYSLKSLNQAVGIAAMCLEEEPSVRPYITDVVAALTFLEMTPKDENNVTGVPAPVPSQKGEDQCDKDDSISDHSSEYSSSGRMDDHHERGSYSSHNNDDDDDDLEENVEEEDEDNYNHSEGDKNYDNGSSDDHYTESSKSRSMDYSEELSDDESMYSSSTRTSTSSRKEEQ
ncbi:hypothetical protein ACET3Z_005473 [Daucus carota]